jgi:nucleoside-diphosphate-sugar epimerase
MFNSKILVLGGTGPAGICLLRELLHRNHNVVAYARSPSKIPAELASNPHLSVVKGEMDDQETFATAIKGCTTVISHLGAQITDSHIAPSFYADMYRNTVIPGMRDHGIKRIFLMGTMAIQKPEDSFTIMTPVVVNLMRIFTRAVYHNIQNIAEVFEKDAGDLDWTVFRIAAIPGESDEESWRKGREEGKLYVGPLGAKGWTMYTNRSLLARWLVDAAESGAPEWVRMMPAVTRLAGS